MMNLPRFSQLVRDGISKVAVLPKLNDYAAMVTTAIFSPQEK
jgi:hypothetical protein